MFEKLEPKLIPCKYTVVIDHGDQTKWSDKDIVAEADYERVIDYLLTSEDIKHLVGMVFYTNRSALKLSFRYKIKFVETPGSSMLTANLYHHRVFVHPPIELLKMLHKYIPGDVHEFILMCREKYSIKKLSYDDATWLMSLVLGAKE